MEHDTLIIRKQWLEIMLKIARPVFYSFANDNFKKSFKVDAFPKKKIPIRSDYAHLEALGRSLAGIGPWLNLKEVLGYEESQVQIEMRNLVSLSLQHATDKSKSDFLNFNRGKQPLVDAAFLAVGLLRSWDSVWLKLSDEIKLRIISCLKSTRKIKPNFSNWILFTGVIEAFLARTGADYDSVRIDYSLNQINQWYLGSGTYSDGPVFKYDYYNSYVIHPFIMEILNVVKDVSNDYDSMYKSFVIRLKEQAILQEKMINPDGSFPVLGRSMTYRFGAFHSLSYTALTNLLPEQLTVGTVRSALTAVMKRTLLAPETLTSEGWLNIGLVGEQPHLAEDYLSTGSMYIALCGFLPLGLSEKSKFWTDSDEPWTSLRVWGEG